MDFRFGDLGNQDRIKNKIKVRKNSPKKHKTQVGWVCLKIKGFFLSTLLAVFTFPFFFYIFSNQFSEILKVRFACLV